MKATTEKTIAKTADVAKRDLPRSRYIKLKIAYFLLFSYGAILVLKDMVLVIRVKETQINLVLSLHTFFLVICMPDRKFFPFFCSLKVMPARCISSTYSAFQFLKCFRGKVC